MPNDFLTPKQIAGVLDVRYAAALKLLRARIVKATKEKGKWQISQEEINRFQAANRKAIQKLQKEYTALYWGGAHRAAVAAAGFG